MNNILEMGEECGNIPPVWFSQLETKMRHKTWVDLAIRFLSHETMKKMVSHAKR